MILIFMQIIDHKKQKCFSGQTLFSVEQDETDSVEGGWYVWQVVCWPRWRSSGWEGMGGSGRRWTGVGWWELAWSVRRASLISASSRAAWKQKQYQHSMLCISTHFNICVTFSDPRRSWLKLQIIKVRNNLPKLCNCKCTIINYEWWCLFNITR